ncbi:MAG TPA: PhzF family phenazine biosynthesis protein [Candidatus Nanopelagicales bacterium]|nr:PhzF family phenazine biosynthesis protein [Candidatus Nanopelagicales bacterium]
MSEPTAHPFRQVDVFGAEPYAGNPVAVVLDADGLDTAVMRRFSVWSNLSECTFVLPPTSPDADYRVRIFSLAEELPFAGHPTLGTARAWLDAGGTPAKSGVVVQECGAGLVPVRVEGDVLSFAAPERIRSGPVGPDHLAAVVAILGVAPERVVDAAWLDNGPGWTGLLLDAAETVLALTPDASAHPGRWDIGVIGPTDADADARFELRAFFGSGEAGLREDPVTGSLNASAAQWLLETGRASAPYLAQQGTAMGRRGRIQVSADDRGVWVGGRTAVAITGTIML